MPLNYNFAFKNSNLKRWVRPKAKNILASKRSNKEKIQYLYQIYKKEVNVNNSYNYNNGNLSKELNSKKKVLWILYDALDPEFLDKKINGTKIFKNFNSLKDSGLYFENAYSPGKFTNDSVPGQLMEINI